MIEDKAEITRPCNRRDWNATMVIKEDKAEKTRPCKRRDWTCNNGDKRTRQRKLDQLATLKLMSITMATGINILLLNFFNELVWW